MQSDPSAQIILKENRDAEGVDRFVPQVLIDGALYDNELDRFLLDLPLNGVRSRHSLRAIGYDIVVWLRFLSGIQSKRVWEAEYADVVSYHRARRRPGAPFRVSAATWNRCVASLDKLYGWGVEEGLIAKSPFKHRRIWRREASGRRGVFDGRNTAYEPAAEQNNIKFVSLEHYRFFRTVGLRGYLRSGEERPRARDRNGERNALFADLMVSTGLRLEEATSLFSSEMLGLARRRSRCRQIRFDVAPLTTKGDRGRTILIPRKHIAKINDYIEIERACAVEKFRARKSWQRLDRPIFAEAVGDGAATSFSIDGAIVPLDRLTPDERARLVICADNAPQEPAALWLSEIGLPVRTNSWEAIFARARRRCKEAGLDVAVSPHTLRHTFAVHMLAMLIEEHLDIPLNDDGGGMETYRRILGDPLQQVQRLLGHASLATTYIYLDHLAAQADTVDAAVERLLETLDDGYVL